MQKQKYTIYACLIISFATYSFSLKEANQLVIDYQESMSLVSSYMVRKAQAEEVTNGFNRRMINKAQEPQEAVDEVLKVKETNYENSESLVVKAKPESIKSKIKEVFGEDWNVAQAVAMAESRMNPDAVGDKHLSKPSYGLFQISRIYHKYPIETLLDPDENIRIAKEISSKGRGFENWTTYRTGQYLEHLIK